MQKDTIAEQPRTAHLNLIQYA